jgi:serine/threonine-protein kinase
MSSAYQAQPGPQTASVPAPVDNDLSSGSMIGEYRVEGKIGEGGMGSVYSSVHPLIGKKAAIKVISQALCTDASAVERFVQEARSVNQIGHPNIVDIFSFGALPDGRSYFVMEWLQGKSLSDRLAEGNLSLGEAVEVLEQIADALEAAHEKGIVHRDLKPDNVFLVAVRGNRQLVKLLDFGIAKLAGGDQRMHQTRTGMMMGTPGYMSPEQARGKAVDHRTDIYALGAMIYEMLLGRLPFEADNAMDIVMKHLTEAPPAPSTIWPEIPPELEQVLLKMLEKEPNNRPTLPDVRAQLTVLRGLLLQALGEGGGVAYPSGFGPRVPTPASGTARLTPPPSAVFRVPTQAPQGPSTSVVVDPELTEAAPKKSKALMFAVLGVVLVGGGMAAALVLKGGKEAPAQAQAASVPAAASEPAKPAAPEPKAQAAPAAGGTILVSVDVSGARIEVDGDVVAQSASSAKVPVDKAGDHLLVVTAPGYKPYQATVPVAAGAQAVVAVKMERLATASAKPAKPVKPSGEKKKSGGSGSSDYTLDPFGN